MELLLASDGIDDIAETVNVLDSSISASPSRARNLVRITLGEAKQVGNLGAIVSIFTNFAFVTASEILLVAR